MLLSPRATVTVEPTPSSSSSSSSSSWDSMLPGPPNRNNFGSSDLSPHGLLAFPSGSSLSIIDTRSMQLLSSFPIPPPSSATSSLSPFVTALRWTPLPLNRDLLSTEPSSSHLFLAAGDRQGRIALLDFRIKSAVIWFDTDSKLGVQDLCWVQVRPDLYLIAAIHGSSTLSLYNASTGRCLWKYDASPEFLSCVRRDPFDSRRICAIGLKGFLLSVVLLGDSEESIVVKELQIRTDSSELIKVERDAASAAGSAAALPASAAFPLYTARFAFSQQWRHILFVTFPRELLVFDLQYETVIFTSALPRGCGKFLDVLPDPNNDWVYCAHIDGKLSTWRRKPGEQVHVMCSMEELMPSIGTSVPSPSILSVLLCQSDSTIQNIGISYSDVPSSPYLREDFDNPFDFCDESIIVSKMHLISISDDGKIWDWLLTTEGHAADTQKDDKKLGLVNDDSKISFPEATSNSIISSTGGRDPNLRRQKVRLNDSKSCLSSSILNQEEMLIKISLVGQLQLLSSTVTMLAVPTPSLTATLARGGNYPAAAVPLVALGTQNGTIEVVDVSANAVASSLSVHNGIVRGLRWLGNSRLVSFSYSQANEKSGGYINKLAVTCLRSGLNKMFRVLQKPERAPIRALRTSSSGRYLLILFRDAPVEVWAMTKSPIMLRSLALPFTVLEWTLPTVPRPAQNAASRDSSLSSKEQTSGASDEVFTSSKISSSDSKGSSTEGFQDDTSESFAFALVNGALGVFEVQGRRIRDFRPKWPSSSFVSSDGLITAMAYRLPHVVMGDRIGNIRWWDVTTGHSSSFNTHREGIRRIKFSPFVPGDHSRGRIAVLFYDNTFSVFDLDSPDPLANSLLQPQFPGTLVLELDWLPLRTDKNDPLVLCIAGADSSFRLVEITANDKRSGHVPRIRNIKERFRSMPICCPIILPTPHALAVRMILQLGVKPSWFNTCSTTIKKRPHLIPGTPSSVEDLRTYMINIPPLGDSVVPEMLLKVLEPYRKEGCILDDERAKLYASILDKGCAARFAFAATIFGESSEALFWLQLRRAFKDAMNKLWRKPPPKGPSEESVSEVDETSLLSRILSKGKPTEEMGGCVLSQGQLRSMTFDQEELWKSASERISWHEKLEGEEAIQKRVHELVSVGNLEVAVSLLLSTPPESSYFYVNALRAFALSSAVSKSLHELAVKVVAANMVRADRSLSGTHLLCAVGRYQEACSQLQDAGCWTDAATLAASHLQGSDYARVLQRWAGHVLYTEHNIWRALILYVAAGALQEALTALRKAQLPDTAAMFVLACREIHAEIVSNLGIVDDDSSSSVTEKLLNLRDLDPENEDVIAVDEYFGEYQRKLVHLCMDSQPFSD
ncbi:PREDICTED: WD repeat-containing protein 11-like isoform X3 [Lupinus angustifolius]|uniref:WD repeat-containing protein 11-like isoform X3 n=1 Tax=Lupinus angustifolius TaxID=3871 RepID=UPI00092F4B1C|nr:PREDICTED: WD repeat-containing protein 11-like isoform X3 [Lupinus angustifolius]